MKKRYVTAIALALPAAMMAQTAIDAYQMSRYDLRGTARYMSMGGAFGDPAAERILPRVSSRGRSFSRERRRRSQVWMRGSLAENMKPEMTAVPRPRALAGMWLRSQSLPYR